ncbi:hypothetical protein Pelo_9010 [Pelomyxa schiedti]|nr:hypothetical protein Pelo_9010 [Pelomyxa schiedti]
MQQKACCENVHLFQQFQCCCAAISMLDHPGPGHDSNDITRCEGASMKAHLTTVFLRAPFPKVDTVHSRVYKNTCRILMHAASAGNVRFNASNLLENAS